MMKVDGDCRSLTRFAVAEKPNAVLQVPVRFVYFNHPNLRNCSRANSISYQQLGCPLQCNFQNARLADGMEKNA